MSKWTSLKADYGWRLTPDGFLEQWGRGNYGNGDGDFVIPFPNRCVFVLIREGANKQVISSQADSLIKISRIWADFFPANTSNQPI
nr:hypothetical protein [Citrobacter freundii]